MDYLTRRSVAARGVHGARLEGIHARRWPRLSALGVRIENASVARDEITQVLEDIGEAVPLPAGRRLPADELEKLLEKLAPDDLRRRINSFLDQLAGKHPLRHETE